MPALICKTHEAKLEGRPSVESWGTGRPQREFLFVEDLADALVFVMARYSAEEPLNIGTGEEITVIELARLITQIVGFEERLVFDNAKPDRAPRKLLEVSRLHALGWYARTSLNDGLAATYRSYLDYKAAHQAVG